MKKLTIEFLKRFCRKEEDERYLRFKLSTPFKLDDGQAVAATNGHIAIVLPSDMVEPFTADDGERPRLDKVIAAVGKFGRPIVAEFTPEGLTSETHEKQLAERLAYEAADRDCPACNGTGDCHKCGTDGTFNLLPFVPIPDHFKLGPCHFAYEYIVAIRELAAELGVETIEAVFGEPFDVATFTVGDAKVYLMPWRDESSAKVAA